jgi:hypothetical protein
VTSARPPRIAIYGQYKTGTTGLFYRLLGALPPGTRRLFEAEAYRPEPADDERAVLAKVILGLPGPGWTVDYASFRGFDRHVYLVRDPRDWVVSGLLFLVQQERAIWSDDRKLGEVLGLLERKQADPRSLPAGRILGRIVELGSGGSLAALTGWMAAQARWLRSFEEGLPGAYRIRYEDFADGALEGLAGYLGFALGAPAPTAPEHEHTPRTLSHGNWRDWFLAEDVEVFRPVFREYMEHYGYGDDWTPSPRPVIRPEHCVEYVRRVVARRREARPA